jgi:sugar/nucleoside kinase (ribokinase family)
MKVTTLGGATQDIFLCFEGADSIQINRKSYSEEFLIFCSGEKIEVNSLFYCSGGGATNTAVSFKRLGFEVNCICKVSKDEAGDFILTDLNSENINTKYIIFTDKYSTGRSFIINVPSGERTIFAFRGANATLEQDEIMIDAILSSNLLYITSLSGISSQILPHIVSLASKKNIPIAINPGTSQLSCRTDTLKNVLPSIDTLILNSAEAKIFMVGLLESDNNYKKVLRCFEESKICALNEDMSSTHAQLLEKPIPYENIYLSNQNFFKAILKLGVKTVVVTDGENGVYVACNDYILFYPSIKTDVVDTVGAGDSFGSCFVAFKFMGFSIEDSLRYGMVNSSSVISNMGAKCGLLSKDGLIETAKLVAPPSSTMKFKL